ncbi:MAG: hypothetical protein PHU25_19070 [Deltaproteobacteria bacterium]|nr:hypothetical protein [Deltaproteobacteria bacterium]
MTEIMGFDTKFDLYISLEPAEAGGNEARSEAARKSVVITAAATRGFNRTDIVPRQ